MTNEQFKKYRLKLGMTQKELATALRVSLRTISYCENGAYEIPFLIAYWLKDQIGKS